MNDLLRLVKRHPVWIGLVSHLRKAPNNKGSFEEGRLPSIDDIRGSGSIKQISFDIISFARNLTADNDKERNTIKMRILKSRYTGLTGSVKGAHYIYDTGRLLASTMDIDEEFVSL
jgi:twinkle protein